MTNNTSGVENKNTCVQCALKESSVFMDCPNELLNEFFSHKTVEHFHKGDFLITQNEEFKGVYCLQQGVVKIIKSGDKKKEFILWLACPGDIIGLDSFINNERYTYSAKVMDEVCACFIPASDFRAIVAQVPAISIGLMKNLCEKINFIEGRITSIARKKIRKQFAEMMISLAVKNKKHPTEEVQVNYSINDMANIIGTTKTYLYKILSDFSNRKIIIIRNRKLFIRDFNKLSHIAVGD